MAGIVLALLGDPADGQGLQRLIDQGSFAILRGGRMIGREDFTVRHAPVGGRDGFIIGTTAYYPADGPLRTISAVIQVHADSQIATARFDMTDGARYLTLIDVGPRRITVRLGVPGGESTREYPVRGVSHVRHDSVFAVHAVIPQGQAGPMTLISPVDGAREAATLHVQGLENTSVAGAQARLRHVTLETQRGNHHLWYDQAGRLVKVTIPSQELTAERRPLPQE